jgi:hypothetical protein
MPLRGLRLSEDLKTRLGEVQKAARLSVSECLHPGSDRGKASANGRGRVRFGVRGANRCRLQSNRARSSFGPQHPTGSVRAARCFDQVRINVVVEPPQDLLVSARARGKLRYEKLLREAAKTITGECENLLLESVASAD